MCCYRPAGFTVGIALFNRFTLILLIFPAANSNFNLYLPFRCQIDP